jgi:hypothetical protein
LAFLSVINFVVAGIKRGVVFDWGFNASTQYKSYGDSPGLMVGEDLWCRCVHYFREKRPE